jgi:hypothetical protein
MCGFRGAEFCSIAGEDIEVNKGYYIGVFC